MPPEAIQSIATNTVARIIKEGALTALVHVDRAVAAVPVHQREDLLANMIGQFSVITTVLAAATPMGQVLVEKMRDQSIFHDIARRFDAKA